MIMNSGKKKIEITIVCYMLKTKVNERSMIVRWQPVHFVMTPAKYQEMN